MFLNLPRSLGSGICPIIVSFFFVDVIDKVVFAHNGKTLGTSRWEGSPHPVYEIEYRWQRLAFFHPGVGSSLSAALLE